MASMIMSASSLAGMGAKAASSRRGMRVVTAAKASEGEKAKRVEMSGRREMMAAAAAAAVFAVSKIAMADDEEPKRGTTEAKKKYSQVCVTMPTARICHK